MGLLQFNKHECISQKCRVAVYDGTLRLVVPHLYLSTTILL